MSDEDEMVADYDVRSPAQRTLLTVVGTLLVAAVAVGAVLLVSKLMTSTRVETASVDAAKFSQVILKAEAAHLTIVPSATKDELSFSANITSGLRSTHYELLRNGDEIVVDSSCRSWVSPGCGVELTVGVPDGMSMLIETTSGDMVLDEFSATTVSGDVEADFAVAPYAIKVDTLSGDVEVAVPVEGRSFLVDLRSDSGDVETDVSSDPSGEGFIRLTSSSGDIELDPR